MPPTTRPPMERNDRRTRPVRRSRRLGAAAAGLVLASSVLAATGTTLHPEDVDHVVTMGAVDPALGDNHQDPGGPSRTDRFEYLAYYPEHLRVHRGDTVWFERDGFHSVVFAPEEPDGPLFLRRDEVPQSVAMRGADPSDPSCTGSHDVEPCILSDPDQVLDSGWSSFKVRVDLPPGTYGYHCSIHENMRGTVEVVPDDVPVPDRWEVADARAQRIAEDSRRAEEVMERGQTPDVEVVDGVRTWRVRAGDFTDDGRVAVLRFLPSDLEIAPGDDVEFVVPDTALAGELHTASFPQSAWPFGFVTYLDPRCDPDDPGQGAFGVPLQYALLVAGSGCPAGTVLEMGVHPWAYRQPLRAPGGVVATPATVHDTGWLAPGNLTCASRCDPWGDVEIPSRATASFPAAGTFAFQCNVHPEWGMVGVVEVVA